MQTARSMKQLASSARLVLRTFASSAEGTATLAYNPAKGPKAAYVPADARKASDNAKSLFRKLREDKAHSLSGQGASSNFSHKTKESTTVIGGSRAMHKSA